MYRMITGKVPPESVDRALSDELVEPSKQNVNISASTENALMNALNVYQNERTASAEEFYKELNSNETKRRKVKHTKRDTGKVPVWIKGLAAVGAAAVIIGGVFVVKGLKNTGGNNQGATRTKFKIVSEVKNSELNLDDFDDAPMLPQDDDDTYDLQKELEAKFDELFGPLDDDENK